MTYQPLESTQIIDARQLNFSMDSTSSILSYTYTLLIAVVIMGAFFILVKAAIERMLATSANSVSKSNKSIQRALLGLIGVFLIYPILNELNPTLLQAGLQKVALYNKANTDKAITTTANRMTGGQISNNGAASGQAVNTTTSSSLSQSCNAVPITIANIQGGDICANTSCNALSGCNWKGYEDILRKESGKAGIDWRFAAVIMCRESHGKADSVNSKLNSNGTVDCGLMQINKPNSCDATIMDPSNNIREGVLLLKQRLNSPTQTFKGVPKIAQVAAGYNCCGGGDNPNSVSIDCNKTSGFENPTPKWACPINPGATKFNMCAVKNYACDVTSCISQLPN